MTLKVTKSGATIAFMNDAWEPVEPDEATQIKIIKPDGSVVFARVTPDAPANTNESIYPRRWRPKDVPADIKQLWAAHDAIADSPLRHKPFEIWSSMEKTRNLKQTERLHGRGRAAVRKYKGQLDRASAQAVEEALGNAREALDRAYFDPAGVRQDLALSWLHSTIDRLARGLSR